MTTQPALARNLRATAYHHTNEGGFERHAIIIAHHDLISGEPDHDWPIITIPCDSMLYAHRVASAYNRE